MACTGNKPQDANMTVRTLPIFGEPKFPTIILRSMKCDRPKRLTHALSVRTLTQLCVNVVPFGSVGRTPGL